MAPMRCFTLLAAALGLAAAAAAPLTVHIIPHSHCDPGWLESFEGYYQSQVHSILSSVMRELEHDPRRRFQWAETSFWMRWYEVQTDETKQLVNRLVASGQLEFIGGGWVQNDEANPDPISIIAQLTEGHEYLQSLFGKRPRIAWQIDPFGHSAAFAALAASAGYEALVINRIDHNVKDALKARAGLEFVWHPYATQPERAAASGSTGAASTPSAGRGYSYSNASIYTHVLHTHYSAPRGFDFENPEGMAISDWNVAQRAQQFANDMRNRARSYRTPHLLVPFGDDFKFQDANRQFSNMDQLIRYINARNGVEEGDYGLKSPGSDDTSSSSSSEGKSEPTDPTYEGLVLRYSTLSEYFDAVSNHIAAPDKEKLGAVVDREALAALATSGKGKDKAVVPIPVYGPLGYSDGGADFFPYADNPTSYWTGYYVSRPQLKSAIRRTAAVLRAGEALVAMVRPWAQAWQSAASGVLEKLAAALAGDKEADGSLQSSAVDVAPYASFSWLKASQRLEQVRLDAALCLHHDAITGTSRDSVVTDYTRRMTDGHDDVLGVATDVASLLLGGMHRSQLEAGKAEEGGDTTEQLLAAAAVPQAAVKGDGRASLAPAPLTHVPHVLPVLDRVTLDVTETAGGAGAGAGAGAGVAQAAYLFSVDTPGQPVVLYNPSGWARRTVVNVVVNIAGSLAAAEATGGDQARDEALAECQRSAWPYGLVTEEGGLAVPSQWTAVVDAPSAARSVSLAAAAGSGHEGEAAVGSKQQWPRDGVRYELSFSVDLPPMSLRTYFVTAAWLAGTAQDSSSDATCGTADARLAAAGASISTSLLQVPELKQRTTTKRGGKGGKGGKGEADAQARLGAATSNEGSTVVLENACVAVEVSAFTGLLMSVTRKHATAGTAVSDAGAASASKGIKVGVRQRFGMYETRASGAYLFRPLSDPNLSLLNEQGADDRGNAAEAVTVSVTRGAAAGEDGSSSSSQGGLVQIARVAGKHYSQTIRVVDTLGWSTSTAASGRDVDYAALCADPLHPDAGFEVLPTVHAGGNQELVMIMEADLDVTAGRVGPAARGTNTRDNIPGYGYHPELLPADQQSSALGSGSSGACAEHSPLPAPMGWWTSDGLGLLRRTPGPVDLPKDQLSRYFYPLNTMTRLSGVVTNMAAAAASDGGAAYRAAAAEAQEAGIVPSAWLSVYTQSPFGVMARMIETEAPPEPAPKKKRAASKKKRAAQEQEGEEEDGGWTEEEAAQAPSTGGDSQQGGAKKVRGTRMEIMLHRHLSQDDGRGLATGVFDNTVITPRLLFTVGAAVHPASSASGEKGEKGGEEGSTCGLEPPADGAARGNAHDAAAAAHPDWTWKWAATAAQHSTPVLMLHADLEVLHRELASGGRTKGRTASFSSSSTRAAEKPPADPAMDVGGVNPDYVLAEEPLPRREWVARFSTRWEGLPATPYAGEQEAGAPSGPLPPWVHLLTLQPRDAVTDDVVLRLQNVGGPAVTVDISRVLTGLGVSTPGVSAEEGATGGVLLTRSLRPRSLTMNGPETKAGSDRDHVCGLTCLAMRSSGPRTAALERRIAAKPAAYAGLLDTLAAGSGEVKVATALVLQEAGSGHATALASAEELAAGRLKSGSGPSEDEVARQNTEEEGVFISDAALEKARAAAAGPRRLLLEEEEQEQEEEEEQPRRRATGKKQAAGKSKRLPPRKVGAKKATGGKAPTKAAKDSSQQWKPLALPASAEASEAVAPSYSVTLAPSSIRSFFLTLTPAPAGAAGGAEPAPVASVGGAAGASGAAAGGAKRKPARKPAKGKGGDSGWLPSWLGGDDAADSKGGSSTSKEKEKQAQEAASLAMWRELVEALPLPEGEKDRMRAVLDSGSGLEAKDERTLFRLTRVATREHKQAMPDGLEDSLARVVAQRRAAAAGHGHGKGRKGRQDSSASSASSFWSEDALEPTDEDRAVVEAVLGRHRTGAVVDTGSDDGSSGSGSGDRDGSQAQPTSAKASKGPRPKDARRLPSDAWANTGQKGQRKPAVPPAAFGSDTSTSAGGSDGGDAQDAEYRPAAGGKGKGKAGRRPRPTLDLDADAVEVPVVHRRGEQGEDISVTSLLLSLAVWLLAAGGLLSALRCLCACRGGRGGKRAGGGSLLPTTIGDVEEANAAASGVVDGLFAWSKRMVNPGKVQ